MLAAASAIVLIASVSISPVPSMHGTGLSEFSAIALKDITNAHGRRWEAKKETAYPSTFIRERGGRVRFAHVSKSHGNRVSAARALTELQ